MKINFACIIDHQGDSNKNNHEISFLSQLEQLLEKGQEMGNAGEAKVSEKKEFS